MVMVYHFRIYDGAKGESIIGPRKATKDWVEKIDGEILKDTAEEVGVSELDADGLYSPKKRPRGDIT